MKMFLVMLSLLVVSVSTSSVQLRDLEERVAKIESMLESPEPTEFAEEFGEEFGDEFGAEPAAQYTVADFENV